ncbi:centromere protein U [Catharus ustulatus]|uniref:centromere protein U n=1 Tax=Catharus ustulatus TaxID=91951 RepID=UPI00140DE9E4|nr:centromere protein U [Catharus ustulatus]XP_032916310.1 centromere protein U [Catharus ustulatus]XP_032916311.1 centromere protein U [Catharus ustulatus]XP_032916313.1 centromere protein U [Catharus ustulatus]
MASKKKIKKNHASSKLEEHKASSSRRWKSLPLEEPDVSRILKVAETNQLEDLDDSFDHPLHSTAVDAYGEEHSQNEALGHVSAPQRQNTDRRSSGKQIRFKKPHHSKPSDGDVQKFNTADAGEDPLKEPVAKKKQPSEQNTSDLSVDSPHYVEMWCPKELKRSPRDITELDVVLAKVEKIAASYRQSIESKICRKAIDDFHSAFKDQITDLIAGVQELKNMKKKNAKAITNIKKKSPQLLQVRDELIGAELQLTQLQREYAELQERKSSLRQAIELITDLKELQQDCLDYLEENPKEKVVYGTSSLPALLVESQRILGAEGHFESINMKLEEALAAQKGQKAQKN